MPDGVVPVPPDRIRPGQLGVVMLGRVIIGDIATTLVDLSVRGMLAVEEQEQHGQAGWLVGAGRTGHQPDALLAYEQTLLAAVSEGNQPVTVQSLAPRMPQVLAHARDEIMQDAVSNGWLHWFHHDQRTDSGDQLAMRIRRFQRDLRKFATDQGKDAVTGRLLPFALHFGMLDRDQTILVKFAHAWVAAFASLPAWHQPDPSRPNLDQADAVAKPTIDEQMMDPYVAMGIRLTGWGT
jgi:hypothetical protein